MKKIGYRIVVLCLILIILKNELTPFLLRKATYGMPVLIEKGEITDLYIGSSMFRQGLDIFTLENNEEDSYILAYNGNQPVLECEQLEYLLQNEVKIKNLYIDMYVYSAWSEPKIQDEKLFLEVGLREKINIWRLISNRKDSKFQDFWRMFISSNNELLLIWPINNVLINSQFYKGGAKTQSLGINKQELEKLDIPLVDGYMNTEQKKSIEEIIEICRRNGINLCFVETPKYQRIAEDTNYLLAMQEYTNFLVEQEVPMILCLNTYENIDNQKNIQYYEFDNECAEYFVDLIHLSYSGRVAFSEELRKKGKCIG